MRDARPLKVFVGALAHETNTFSPLPTTRRSFEAGILHKGGNGQTLELAKTFPGYGDMLAVCSEAGDLAVAGLCAWAQPGGPVPHPEFERLCDELLADIHAAGPLDAIVLVLHGAMVSSACWDCEGELLKRLRAQVGPTPVGVLLDLHGNLTESMLASGALLIACKEYPHTDYRARARELHALLAQAARGQRSLPRPVMRPVPMLALMGTTAGPMKDFVAELSAREGRDGIVSVSAMHGFPWSDTPHSSAALMVWWDPQVAEAEAAAQATADALAQAFFRIGAVAAHDRLDLARCVAALRQRRAAQAPGPIVLADGADNAGGGAASDSTFVLQALLAEGLNNVALGMVWDPQAAAIAADAGVGARIPLRIGGKVGPQSGAPVDLDVEVVCVRHDATQRGLAGGREPLGLAVTVRTAAVEIVINSIRQQVFTPECFTEMGIDLQRKWLVVVKSTQHFRAGFDALASEVIYCDAAGSLNSDLSRLPFQHLKRPLWPLDPAEAITIGADMP